MPRTVPNLILIGAAKAGTTFLAGLLDQHPDIAVSRPKEPKFFSTYWDHGWDWYVDRFAHANGTRVLCDASTQYSILGTYPRTIDRIAEHAPDARFVYVVRNPFDRLVSQWTEDARSWQHAAVGFEDAVRSNAEYLDATRYWTQYTAYRDVFGADRVHVLFFDELTANPGQSVRGCFEFLGLETDVAIDVRASDRNGRGGKRRPRGLLRPLMRVAPDLMRSAYRAMPSAVQRTLLTVGKGRIESPRWTPELRAFVAEELRDDNVRLLGAFGKPTDHWSFDALDTHVATGAET